MRSRELGGDRGSVVAEFAVALPAVVVVVLLSVAALTVSAQQVRLQDAAADAARLAARGEDGERIHGAIGAGVPGARSTVSHEGDLVCVSATAPAHPVLPITLSARSCGLAGGW
ncbi:TadE family type IV pilus minor pilin [Microbacterium sp. ET2]|uniref:TadE family type IV pilus minor pilin n=1 Tax=Microbacterium albipurpureum TaxID=3050384 RepID=UPI00259CB52F|nr:TadE family type IV pilus minor pilin [Microbacterium sp. ET2 (Ac-2212)]WJL96220.1 TadE family type IV pilus minor pilin [Microbacterium sp. ET2 (Ac-2212)]